LKTQVLAKFILDKFIRLIPSYSLPHIIGWWFTIHLLMRFA
jgi:hypothetical protein